MYNLSKAIYGLWKASRVWNIRLYKSLKSLNFMKCSQEQAVYTRNNETETLIVGVYVDDLIVTGTSVEGVKVVK